MSKRSSDVAAAAGTKKANNGPKALPKIFFGTSSLGNLFSEPTHAEKKAVIEQVLGAMDKPVFDSAGKYGAGLALEELGRCLEELGVAPDKVLISNKLAWKRVPLTTPEPTFEPGAWVNLKNDAVQQISYEGILECYEEGNALLGKYNAQIVSVHDPDEYLSGAKDDEELKRRQQGVLGAYKALGELKAAGRVESIGVGAKDIRVIDWIIENGVQLDWAMFACSITPYTHSLYARGLCARLGERGVNVINSAVFNAGFLIGGDNFDYAKVSRVADPDKFAWRDRFNELCALYKVTPAAACVQFSFLFGNISSVALNTTKASRVISNVALANARVPNAFWHALKREGLTSFAPPATIRHSVHLQLTAEATDAQKKAMVDAVRGMQFEIGEICDVACALDAGLSASGNHGFALTADFADAAGYQTYATHPAHVAVITNFIKPILVAGSRTAVQFAL